jgi:PEP-CTERM motif
MTQTRVRWIGLSMILAAAVGASNARADTILYQIGLGNPAISPYTGPYADVLVDRTSTTTAQVTFTSLSNGTETFLLGDGGSAAVNVNATIWSIGSILGSNGGVGFAPGPFSDGGSGVEDGFGSFNQTVNDFDGYMHTVSSLQFVLTNGSSTWASAADVLTPNASGYIAAAHIFVSDCGSVAACDAGTGALATGFATVPEPSTALMLGLGLVALASRRRGTS